MKFSVTGNDSTNSLTIQTRNGNEIWKRSEKKVSEQIEMKVDENILDMYTGQYKVTPGFTFSVTLEKGRLYLQAEGQEETGNIRGIEKHILFKSK
jgi:hypothetical protein